MENVVLTMTRSEAECLQSILYFSVCGSGAARKNLDKVERALYRGLGEPTENTVTYAADGILDVSGLTTMAMRPQVSVIHITTEE